ncbi:hypothetical protein AtubIFM56815_009892 [Aspergillus tubingensis]|uniref:Uncharacterized protein n=2 Tax=Aspergillus subgen. Circumdati TaxID=2720871 RepID=A0A100I5J1_ASPNG|nr:conserved hypothetical protein [Aspergillus niger]GLA64399.1 hypothetical protein AtubIFM54640_006117 [Aspergillus tubingensis]GLA85651.1 hypothetical protein AtubIFM56815_009892 [Aspergillus tubingensis]
MDVALNAALCQLGFQPQDILDRLELGHLPMWTNALQWKFNGEGHRFGLEQFNHLTSDFDAILHTPCCLYTEKAMATYPETHVILNTRDVDG